MRHAIGCGLIWLASTAAAIGADDQAASLPEARVFSFKIGNATTTQALDELARQSGIRVEDRIDGAGPISLELTKTTFWQSLDAIARAARARVDLYARDGRLALVPCPTGYTEPPVSYSGFFRSSLRKTAATRDLASGATTYTATIEVAWEPGLEPLFLDTTPHALVVRDDAGHELPTREEGAALAPVDGRLAREFDVPLPPLPRRTAKLDLLQGRMQAIAPGKIASFKFETLDRLVEAAADSPLRRRQEYAVTCRVTKVQLARDRWTVQVAIEYPPGGVRLESYQSRVVSNELVLETKDGLKHRAADGYVVDMASERRALVSYHFFDPDKTLKGGPAEWRVRYRTPATLVDIPFKFSFRDVSLP
jgi:hypothetical protein